jgi:hypothetical protein
VRESFHATVESKGEGDKRGSKNREGRGKETKKERKARFRNGKGE